MSFLTPFYLAGLAALVLPVVFHLIRRSPSSEILFSSLMFLAPSPPRLTRRSRLDQLLLLFLRGLALALLVAAFARPFFRQAASGQQLADSQRRVAILLDTSASMRRENLWEQAVAKVADVVGESGPLDELAVFTFDQRVRSLVTFAALAEVEPALRTEFLGKRLAAVGPTWGATDLGQALLAAVDAIKSGEDATPQANQTSQRIVLVSDLQAGAELDSLAEYLWPADLRLELQCVSPSEPGNAGLARLRDRPPADPQTAAEPDDLRIRVSNADDSPEEWFALQWSDAAGSTEGDQTDVFVPAGESRVVRVPVPSRANRQPQLVLTGDAHPFDNRLHVVQRSPTDVAVAYFGADADTDPQGLYYYLERTVTTNPAYHAVVQRLRHDEELVLNPELPPRLIVVTTDPEVDQAETLRRHVAQQNVLLYTVTDADQTDGLSALLATDGLSVEEASVDDYAMLGEIDFSHPLFHAMSGPQFSDFTQIRFWKYRKVDESTIPDANVVARFENGDPAVFEQAVGRGRILVMTSGWHPDDSQLARTWKYVLMLSALLAEDGNRPQLRDAYVVNEHVHLPPNDGLAENPSVAMPDGQRIPLPIDGSRNLQADQPGIYTLAGVDGPLSFAVNLSPSESNTSPLPSERFEQLGCRLEGQQEASEEVARQRQLRDVELERQQQIWKWMIVAVCGVLCLETWLAGRLSRPSASEPAMA